MDSSILPPLTVVGPDGDRLTVRALSRADTARALARGLGAEALWTSRRELDPDERLVDIDELRVGTRLASAAVAPDTPRSLKLADVAVISGPSASSWQSLPAGRHLIGRAAYATVRLDDPAIEAHHAVLRIHDDGRMDIVQLTGVVPIRVDGRPWEGAAVDGPFELTLGASVVRIRPLAFAEDARARADVAPGRSGCEVQKALDNASKPAPGSITRHPSNPWRRVVWRAPFDSPCWDAPVTTAPVVPVEPQRPSFTGLIGTGVTACGAVAIATITENPMFMLFAAMGVVAAVATFIVGVLVTRRKRTALRTEHAHRMDAFAASVDALQHRRREYHLRLHRTVPETLDEALRGGASTWQRRLVQRADAESADVAPCMRDVAMRAVVGIGTYRWSPPIEISDQRALDSTLLRRIEHCSRLGGVAAPISIRPGDAVAIRGPRVHSRAVVRSIVAQLATWIGPADWQLVAVSTDRRAWRWVDWLPHGALEEGALVCVDRAERVDRFGYTLDSIETSRHTVLVTDEPQLFTARTGPLRRFVSASNAAVLVVVDTDATVPAMCRRILTVGSTGSASWSGDVPDDDDAVAISFGGISIDTADRVARRLACLSDPEDDGGTGGGVPVSVTFAELLPDTSADAIARRWQDAGPDPAPTAPLGTSVDGRVDVDLVRDGPHGLIAGTTGAGKSELLRTLVLSLAVSVGPEHLNFVLVDYKGGSTFDACTHLPHTVGLVTDLDDGLAERALVSLDAELHRREKILRSVGATDLTDYRSRQVIGGVPVEPIARLVVVIDEFAALAKELPQFLKALVGIAQRGRSLGVHMLLATQRPAGVVNDDIRANTNLRLALRLHDKPDAVDVVGDESPARFPRAAPGRSALRLGPDELIVFQAARCTGPLASGGSGGIIVDRPDRPSCPIDAGESGDRVADERSELEVTVEAIVEAATTLGVAAPHRPWVEPLPFPLVTGQLDTVEADLDVEGDGDAPSIGWVDDPAHQRRVPLAWRPTDGSLALIGSIGSGTTSTMIALAAVACSQVAPDRLHLYVIDARGDDGLSALASIAHCGAVVRLTEDERLHRLLARLVGAIDRRLGLDDAAAEPEPDLVLMIDGYGSLRASLSAVDRQATFDLLQRVVTDGPAVGIQLVLADDGGTATTMLSVAHRWLFHLDDPGIARGLGLRSAPVASDKPGRLRILASGLEAQVAQGAAGLAALPARGDPEAVGGPESIAVLPDEVAIEEVGPPAPGPPGTARLVVGLDGAELAPAVLDVVDGDHVLVVGGPRSGVSTTLAQLVSAWEHHALRHGVPFRVERYGNRVAVDHDVVLASTVRTVIVIDDAHRVEDPGVLADIAKGEYPHVTVLAGARADAVRTAYGHWTREIAKSRCGIVMASRSDPDGDLLAAQLPRRSLVAARPGLGWIIDGGPVRLVQVAVS